VNQPKDSPNSPVDEVVAIPIENILTVTPTEGSWQGCQLKAIVNQDAILLYRNENLHWTFMLNFTKHLMCEDERTTYITGSWPKSLKVV
jgi:hypothetical protein